MKARWFTLTALVAAVVGALVAAFAPTGQVAETSGSSDGTSVTRSSSVSLFQVNGTRVLVVVAVPVLIALIPVLFPYRRTRIVATVLLWIGCVVGLLSVGVFFSRRRS